MANNYTTTSLEALKYLCSVINKTVDLPSTVISDTSIATNTTYSSFKLDKEFTTLEDELKHYTDTAIAGLNKLTKEIINDKALVVKDNVLYLYKADDDPSNDYMQMMLINGVAVELGSTQVDMSDYYSKTDSDNKFAAKVDLDTLTATVNDKINKTSILTAINNDATDDQVYSAKALNTELDGLIEKTDISTTIDSTSTDNTVPTNKAVYNSLINKVDNTVVLNTADEVNSLDKAYQSFIVYPSISDAIGLPNSPSSVWFCIHLSHSKGYTYPSQIAFEYAGLKRIMYRTAAKGVWADWRKIPTTGVADVGVTYINTFEDETYVKPTGTNACSYHVINGHCIVTLQTFCLSTSQDFVQIVSGLPKPKVFLYANAIDRNMESNSGARGVFQITANGVLNVVCNYGDTSITAGRNLYATFSYPVAES